MIPDDELMKEFFQESETNMTRLEELLQSLSSGKTEGPLKESLAEAFRMIHTLAGTCGFFGYQRLGALARSGESLLAAWRDGVLQPSGEGYRLLSEMLTAVRKMLNHLKTEKEEGPAESALVTRLEQVREGGH